MSSGKGKVHLAKPVDVVFTKSAYAITALASLAFFVTGLTLLGYGAVQQSVMRELNLTVTESGLLVSTYFITYSLMQIPGGYFADRWGGEKTIAIFMVITGLAGLELSQVPSFGLALALRAIVGFGAGTLLPAAVRSLNSHLRGHELELATGFFGAGWGISQLVALNLLPFLEAESGWRTSAFAVGLLSLAGAAYAFVVALLIKSPNPNPSVSSPFRARETITKRTMLLVLINVSGIVIPVIAITWAPLEFQTLFKITRIDAARIVSVFGVLTVVSAILGGVATRRLGRKRVMTISMIILLIGVLLLSNPVNPSFGLVLMGVLGFAGLLYISANFSMVPESAPAGRENPGIVFGVYNMISNGISFFPPLLAAFVLDVTGSFVYLFLAVSTVAIIGLLSALLLRTN